MNRDEPRFQKSLKTMKLVQNTPIKIRNDYKKDLSDWKVHDIRDEQMRMSKIEKPRRTYFLWFLSLKLLLEMEQKGMGLRKSKTKIFVIGKDIQIDKEYYREWNLDDVLTKPFWKWWRTKQTLFENPQTVEINNLKEWNKNPQSHYRYLRIDTRKRYSTIMKDIRDGLEDLKDTGGSLSEKVSKYHVYGSPQYDNDILKYNIMVRVLNEEDDMDIFNSERTRLKNIEKKGEQVTGIESGGKITNVTESKIWTHERDWKQLSPEERELVYEKIRKEDRDESEEGKYRLRQRRTLGRDIGNQFKSTIRTELNRYIKDYQKILYGVSQGKFRKPMKF